MAGAPKKYTPAKTSRGTHKTYPSKGNHSGMSKSKKMKRSSSY